MAISREVIRAAGDWTESCRESVRVLRLDPVEIIGPPLHHLPAFRQVLGMIVSGPDRIPFAVGKLTFNHIRTKTVLIQNRAGGAAKAMPGGA